MKPLFEVTEVDRLFYQNHLRDFLPEKIIDVHTHVWLEKFRAGESATNARVVRWPSRVARENSIEDLIETYRLMFPGKEVKPLIFGSVLSLNDDAEGGNAYVSQCAAEHNFPALIFAFPRWSGSELEEKIVAGGFLGAKVYLSLSEGYLPEKEIRIFDFLPHHQLDVLNKHGWIVMLHIPRDGRLRDPVNIAQMLEIEEQYPGVKLIIAHVGRAYCNEDVGDAFKLLSNTRAMCFDFSANTNSDVFRQLIQAVGPKRILFGSDMPILRMRMRRICENGNYINLVPKGLYGDVSDDKHMREVGKKEAARLTFFMYEEIDAFRRAASAAHLTRADIEDVFYSNAARLIEAATPKTAVLQLQMVWPKECLKHPSTGLPRRSPAAKAEGRGGFPPQWSLPEGYILRTYRDGDDEQYIRLMRLAGFSDWNAGNLKSVLNMCLPEGIFFVVHESTGTLAATSVATHNPIALHPYGGELGWLAGDPDHRGRGLGMIVCAAVTKRFLDAGYTDIYLRTDDFRLPAIRTYLKLGWVPLLYASDMGKRWQAVFRKLNMECGSEAAALGT